jgi:hypothetical protein
VGRRRNLEERQDQIGLGGVELTMPEPLRAPIRLRVARDLRLVAEVEYGRTEPTPRLEWGGVSERLVSPNEYRNCLRTFTKLDNAAPVDIFDFAQQWGPLGICRHGQPVAGRGCPQRTYGPAGRPAYWEPISEWLPWIRQAGAIRRLAVDIAQDHPRRAEDWAALKPEARQGHGDSYRRHMFVMIFRDWGRPDKRQERMAIAEAVSNWFLYAGIRPTLQWNGEAYRAGLTLGEHHNLVSILALQLAAELTSPKGIWTCDWCGEIFTVLDRRRPARNRNRFCTACGADDRASKRISARKARAKKSH